MRKTLAVFTLTVLAAVVAVQAGDATDATKEKAAHKTFDGTLVCLGCDLKKAEGARAACSAFGHTHALKTADGQYISLLENKFSKDLIAGEQYHNKPIQIHGIYYANANQLDVESFTVDKVQKGWCDGCKKMDHCPYAQGSKM